MSERELIKDKRGTKASGSLGRDSGTKKDGEAGVLTDDLKMDRKSIEGEERHSDPLDPKIQQLIT